MRLGLEGMGKDQNIPPKMIWCALKERLGQNDINLYSKLDIKQTMRR